MLRSVAINAATVVYTITKSSKFGAAMLHNNIRGNELFFAVANISLLGASLIILRRRTSVR
jgi:hypothetical protein